MKKLILALCLLLTLSACAQTNPASPSEATVDTPVREQPVQPEKTPEETPQEPQIDLSEKIPERPTEVVPTDTPTEEKQPEPPAEISVPDLPPLPQPVYCYDTTVVSSKGQVILKSAEHQPRLLHDAANDDVRAIALTDSSGAVIQLYDLNGQLILDDLYTTECGVLGKLFWYRTQDFYQVLDLTDGTILYQELELAVPVDGMLAVQPMFWMTHCTLLDGNGTVMQELTPNAHLKQVFQTGSKTYLVLEDRFGKQTVSDSKGSTYLGRSYDEVVTITGNYAQVRDGSSWMVVDLTNNKTVYRRNASFLLFPGSVMVETGTRGELKLLNFQGNVLYPSPLLDPASLTDTWITASRPINDTYTTVIVDNQGKEILALPAEATFLSSLSPDLLFYAHFIGEDGWLQKGVLRNMETGREIILMEGKYLKAETLETTEDPLILCRGISLEGTPVSRLFNFKGKELLSEVTILDYAGGDVFVTEEGLICLDGTWLYKA